MSDIMNNDNEEKGVEKRDENIQLYYSVFIQPENRCYKNPDEDPVISH